MEDSRKVPIDPLFRFILRLSLLFVVLSIGWQGVLAYAADPETGIETQEVCRAEAPSLSGPMGALAVHLICESPELGDLGSLRAPADIVWTRYTMTPLWEDADRLSQARPRGAAARFVAQAGGERI